MKQFNIVLSILLFGFLALTSCNDSTLIGTEIIDTDKVNVKVVELPIKATTIYSDTVQTYRPTDQLDKYLCGYMEDPIFGTSQAIFNSQFRLSRFLTETDSQAIENIPQLSSSSLDSVFLVMEVDTNFYGSITNQQLVEVYLLDEPMDNIETYYSDRSFAVSELLGSKMFTPSNPDSTIFYTTNSLPPEIIKPAQMRIQLNENHPLFRDVLFNGVNSLQYFDSDADLLSVFNGLSIRVPSTSSNKGLMLFDPIPPSSSTPSITGVYVHYTSVTDVPLIFRFDINDNAAKMSNFEHENPSPLESDFVSESEYRGDSLFFIQGMSGLNAKLEIQNISSLQNTIINKAELEFTVASDLMNDDPIFSEDPVQQLLISSKNANGDFVLITDLSIAIQNGLLPIFGGNPVDISTDSNVKLYKYKMNITAHIQDILSGAQPNSEIFISPAIRAERPERSIIFGPGHSEHPVKLIVTYTENQ